VKAKAAKRARNDAAWAARAGGLQIIEATALDITAVFAPPDRRRRDADGMLSAIKNYLDGIADVVGVDDSKWSISIRRDEPVKLGAVRIEIGVPSRDEREAV
jgi:crossover junction endodeoxyribonuclease RusA